MTKVASAVDTFYGLEQLKFINLLNVKDTKLYINKSFLNEYNYTSLDICQTENILVGGINICGEDNNDIIDINCTNGTNCTNDTDTTDGTSPLEKENKIIITYDSSIKQTTFLNKFRKKISHIYNETMIDITPEAKQFSSSKLEIHFSMPLMSLESFFDADYDENAKKIGSIDFSNFDSTLVTSLRKLFNGCSSLESINFANFKTESVVPHTLKRDGAGHDAPSPLGDTASASYLRGILRELENDAENNLAVTITISHNNISVRLSLVESLIVINALATKKLQIRRGAWNSIGKRVEKPLVDELCRRAGVPEKFVDRENFRRDKNLPYDRETDYRLISMAGKVYRVEVKLMGRGNPESADMTIARDTDILIADTLSEQSQSQLKERGTEYLMLRGNSRILLSFVKILDKLEIPHA